MQCEMDLEISDLSGLGSFDEAISLDSGFIDVKGGRRWAVKGWDWEVVGGFKIIFKASGSPFKAYSKFYCQGEGQSRGEVG